MQTDITKLLQDPTLPFVVEKLQKHLQDEAKRREEFYNQIDETQKAEFINGKVVMHSPASYGHNVALKRLLRAMDDFVQKFSLGYVGFEKMMIHLTRNSYEPDICFFTTEQAQKFDKTDKLFPAPELVVEVLSPSTEKYDRKIKFEDYEQHNVKEYWLIDPIGEKVEQYVLKNKNYQQKFNSTHGQIESEVIAGFRINAELIFDDDLFFEFINKEFHLNLKLNKKIREQNKKIEDLEAEIKRLKDNNKS